MFKVTVSNQEELTYVSILSGEKLLKKWQGKFAKIIKDEILIRNYGDEKSFLFCRNHINLFLHQVAMLYRSAIFTFNIEVNLEPLELSCNRYNMAEILLLQIKMNGMPIENTLLLADFMENFPNQNFLKFYDVLELLIANKLVKKFDSNQKIFYGEFNYKKQPPNMASAAKPAIELNEKNIASPFVSV